MIILLLAAMSMGAAAQSVDSTRVDGFPVDESKKDTTDTKRTICLVPSVPQYPGGEEALKKFLKKNLKYPEQADQYGVEGSVVINFIVDTDGSIKDISATDCIIERFNTTKFSQETVSKQKELKELFAKLFAKEGARAVRKMPKWTPGTIDGKAVKTSYRLPIHFVDSSK